MISTLAFAAAGIVLATVAYRRGVAIGTRRGLDQRIDAALPRELVPTRQLRRAAGRQIANRITKAAAQNRAPVVLLAALLVGASSCTNPAGVQRCDHPTVIHISVTLDTLAHADTAVHVRACQ